MKKNKPNIDKKHIAFYQYLEKNDPNYKIEVKKYPSPMPSREFIISKVTKNQSLSINNLIKEVCLPPTLKNIFLFRLKAMAKEGQIFIKNRMITVPDLSSTIQAVVVIIKDRYCLKNIENKQHLNIDNIKSIIHLQEGDKVKALLSNKKTTKQKAIILKILERKKKEIEVLCVAHKRYLLGYSINPKENMCCEIIQIDDQIKERSLFSFVNKRVKIQLIAADNFTQKYPKAKICSLVQDNLLYESISAIEKFDLRVEYSSLALQEAESIQDDSQQEFKNRVDLTHLPFVTIDGEDAKDFDDAIYVHKVKNYYKLYVAIADVSHYVIKNSPLDKEAKMRMFSCYFPDRVLHMLPDKLSTRLCSLTPNENKLSLVCELQISKKGKLSHYLFYNATIKSHSRLTYTQVQNYCDHKKELPNHNLVENNIINSIELAELMQKVQKIRGMLEISMPESKIELNENLEIKTINVRNLFFANRMIESFMILANEAAAMLINQTRYAGIFRVHPEPKLEKIKDLKNLLQSFQIEVKENEQTHFINATLNKIKELDLPFLNTQVLRSLNFAFYSKNNIGHFGLALEEYSHFTSPIRRFPDLLLHRIIKRIINENKLIENVKKTNFTDEDQEDIVKYSAKEITTLTEIATEKEKNSDGAMRQVESALKCRFINQFIGESFQGYITAIHAYGFFVNEAKYSIHGLVHMSNIVGDYFEYNEKFNYLYGINTNTQFKIGDLVTMKLINVDLFKQFIDFEIRLTS